MDPVCPFAERVWITIEEKELEHKLRQVKFREREPYFVEMYQKAIGRDPNVAAKAPILIDGELVLAESDLVAYYLDDQYKTGTKLTPDDSLEKFKMR